MGWIFFVILTIVMAIAGIRRAQRAGLWSWSKFVFALGFAGLEVVVITAPLALMDMKSRYFWPVYSAAWVVAAGNFVWFIIAARRWKLPNGKTSLEGDREQRQK
jgi:hypothetical protein